ncbi:MAG: exodeoxyribonuclease large subunit, partial [Chromatiaceae bacterium]|nr:exodeoxyribonuclease large subunit [Chromatiaceae bacterium]
VARLDGIRLRLHQAQARAAEQRGERLARAVAGLEARSPLATLARGYAIVTRVTDGVIIRNASEAPPGTLIAARLAEGSLRAVVEREDPVTRPSGPKHSRRTKGRPPD